MSFESEEYFPDFPPVASEVLGFVDQADELVEVVGSTRKLLVGLEVDGWWRLLGLLSAFGRRGMAGS